MSERHTFGQPGNWNYWWIEPKQPKESDEKVITTAAENATQPPQQEKANDI